MAAQYPAQLPAFTGEVGAASDPLDNPSMPVWAQHVSDEVVAVATELGVTPSGSSSTVKARLDALDTELGAEPSGVFTTVEARFDALDAELGTDPSGGFTTVKARLDAASQLLPFDRAGALTVSAGVRRFRFPVKATIVGVSAAINTAPVGAAVIADVNINGATAFTTQANRPTIADGANDSGAETTPDVTAVAAGDYVTVDVDQVGSTTAGSDLTVVVRWAPAP